MNERNNKMNFLPDRRSSRAITIVYLRSTGYYTSCFGYTGGLFTGGRPYRS
jgi:hypothetical protein